MLIFFVLLFPVTRPEDPDVWFHLSVGERIWTGEGYPTMDRFLFTYPAETPSFHHEWLFQSSIYPLYRAAGMEGLVAVKAILIAGAFIWLFFSGMSGRAFYPSLFYFLVAFAAGSGRFYIKPEIAGAALLAVMWRLLAGPLTLRRVLALAALQVFWTNLHWSSILGVALAAAFALADAAGRLLPNRRSLETGTRSPSPWGYPLLLAAVVAATLVNPDGVQPFIEPFRYFFTSGFLLPVAEVWPTHLALLRKDPTAFQTWYFLALALGSLSFLLNCRRLNLAHLFTFGGMALLSLSAERHVLFFSLLSVPIVNGNILSIVESRRPLFSRITEIAWPALAIVVLTTLTLNKITGLPFLIPYPMPYEPLSAGDSEVLWPHRAAEFVVDRDLPGRIFNNFNSGNYLNWAIFPRKVYINGTFSHRPTEIEYADLKKSPGGKWDAFAEDRGVETVFFRLTPLIAPLPLLRTVMLHPGWALVYYNGTAAVFVKDSPGNGAIIDEHSVDLAKELQDAVRVILSNGGILPGGSLPFWGEIVRYRWRQDQARLFSLRAQFYLLAGRTDLAAIAAEMMRNLRG